MLTAPAAQEGFRGSGLRTAKVRYAYSAQNSRFSTRPITRFLRTTLAKLDAHWARDNGCATHVWTRPGLSICANVLDHKGGVAVSRRGRSTLISCPSALVARVQEMRPMLEGVALENLAAAMAHGLGLDCSAIKVTNQGLYLERGSFVAVKHPGTRALTVRDADELAAFLQACPNEDVEACEIESMPERVGLWIDGRLAAVAGYKRDGEQVADIGFICDPTFRGRGLGLATASALIERIFAHGLIPQWWVNVTNLASRAVARKLGFEYYACEQVVTL